MKNSLFIILLTMLLAPEVSLAEDSLKVARIRFEKKFHDFGDIYQGEEVSYDFHFTNAGTEPVKITRALSNCSCTPVISDTSRVYMPGDTGAVRVTFDSRIKEGQLPKQGIIQRQIDVFYNGYQNSERVSIRINVLPPPKKTSRSR